MQIEIFIGKAGMQPPPKQIKIKKGPKIKHFITPQMQKYLTQGGMQIPKYTYEFRLKKEPEIKDF